MPAELDFSVLDPANAVLTLRADLRFTPGEFDREACYMIEDPLRGKFFRIGSRRVRLDLAPGRKEHDRPGRGAVGRDAARKGLHRKRGHVGLPLAPGVSTGRLRRGRARRTPRLSPPTNRPRTSSPRRSIPWPCGSRCSTPTPLLNRIAPWTQLGVHAGRPWSAGASFA